MKEIPVRDKRRIVRECEAARDVLFQMALRAVRISTLPCTTCFQKLSNLVLCLPWCEDVRIYSASSRDTLRVRQSWSSTNLVDGSGFHLSPLQSDRRNEARRPKGHRCERPRSSTFSLGFGASVAGVRLFALSCAITILLSGSRVHGNIPSRFRPVSSNKKVRCRRRREPGTRRTRNPRRGDKH